MPSKSDANDCQTNLGNMANVLVFYTSRNEEQCAFTISKHFIPPVLNALEM